ncbi:MAG: HAMP domain-containing protein, partial [Deltaproteobacteria bacterium]|nr:HAMP domain-containing protein [Deltaproteobacteria bacterium]
MEFRPNRSIKARLFVAVTLLVTLIVAFQLFFFPARLAKVSLDALEAKAVSVTDLLGHVAKTGLEFEDFTIVQDEFKAAAQDEDLRFLVLYTQSGRRVAAVNTGDAPPFEELTWEEGVTTQLNGELLRVTRSVNPAVGQGGILVAGFSTDRIRQQQRLNRNFTLLTGAGIFLVGMLVAFWLGTSVGNRVHHMAEIADQVARGRLDLPPVAVGARDELGRMASSFNTMLETLRGLQDHV